MDSLLSFCLIDQHLSVRLISRGYRGTGTVFLGVPRQMRSRPESEYVTFMIPNRTGVHLPYIKIARNKPGC